MIDLKKIILYDQKEEMKMEFLRETQVSHALAYVLAMDDQDIMIEHEEIQG
jgi:hypothetical protein